MKRILLIAFGVAVAGELAGILFSTELLITICKPAIMITLGLYYLASASRESRSTLFVSGIVFSCIGDVLLMFVHNNESFFMVGLMAFLMAHVLYILTYRQYKQEGEDDQLRGVQKIRFSFPIVLAGTGMIIVLYPTLNELRVPVMIYTLVIIVMVLNALFRYGHTNLKSFWMVFAGAVLFMISDSLLAINKFLQPVNQATFWIMLTYAAAQFLIVEGLLAHAGKKK